MISSMTAALPFCLFLFFARMYFVNSIFYDRLQLFLFVPTHDGDSGIEISNGTDPPPIPQYILLFLLSVLTNDIVFSSRPTKITIQLRMEQNRMQEQEARHSCPTQSSTS